MVKSRKFGTVVVLIGSFDALFSSLSVMRFQTNIT